MTRSVADVSPVRTLPSFFHEYEMPVSGVTVQVKVTATPNDVVEPPLEVTVGVGGTAGRGKMREKVVVY